MPLEAIQLSRTHRLGCCGPKVERKNIPGVERRGRERSCCARTYLMTSPMGLNPWASKRLLLPVLMNICVVRVPGPDVAKVMVPLVLLPMTGSSLMLPLAFQLFCTSGSPLIPNCTTKRGITRKNLAKQNNTSTRCVSDRIIEQTSFGLFASPIRRTCIHRKILNPPVPIH